MQLSPPRSPNTGRYLEWWPDFCVKVRSYYHCFQVPPLPLEASLMGPIVYSQSWPTHCTHCTLHSLYPKHSHHHHSLSRFCAAKLADITVIRNCDVFMPSFFLKSWNPHLSSMSYFAMNNNVSGMQKETFRIPLHSILHTFRSPF